MVKRDLSSGIGRDENGGKLGQVLRVRGLIQDESVTPSRSYSPFVESPKAKGLSEREGRFRGRGMGRFESANGVLGCKPRSSFHRQAIPGFPFVRGIATC